MNATSSIIRAATRKPGERLNILTAATHEAYQTGLSNVNADFYMLQHPSFKKWMDNYRPLPPNHHLLDEKLENRQIPAYIDFDLVFSQNKFGQFQILSQIARQNQLPIVSLEHTLPMEQWSMQDREQLKNMQGDINIFISEYSKTEWGFDDVPNSRVIKHCIDSNVFKPGNVKRKQHILSVCNDWINRDWCMPAGQKILTKHGYVPIEKIVCGNEVITDSGKYHTVTKIFKRHFTGVMTKVILDDNHELLFTANHAIRVHRDGQEKYVESIRLKKGDILKFPKIKQTDFSFTDKELAWLIGLIIADGSISKGGRIEIALNVEQTDYIERARKKLEEIAGHCTISKRNFKRCDKCVTVEASCIDFANWLKKSIGGKSFTKYIPDFIIDGSDDIKISVLQGLWAGDGHFSINTKNSDVAVYATISHKLSSQVSMLLHHFGIKCSIRKRLQSSSRANGSSRFIYDIRGYGKDNVNNCFNLIQNSIYNNPYQYVVTNVEIDDEWNGEVFNCEVEDDHSYLVYPGIIAHNCCGFGLWQRVTKDLPVFPVGDTKGFSLPAKNIEELVGFYQEAQVFVNTSQVSPIPTSLLEAMSCGCMVISSATCMIPEVIQNGYNGFITNDEEEMRKYLELALSDPNMCEQMGKNARQTIIDNFSSSKFTQEWDKVFEEAANIII